MSDLHTPPDLDRAFDSLAADLAARPGRPGAGAAVATARRRRRTTRAAVGLAAVLVAGAVSLPQVLGPGGLGLAGGLPEPAHLDVSALDDATEGWISGWSEGPASGAWSQPSCSTSPDSLPDAVSRGHSGFHGHPVGAESWQTAGAMVLVETYAGREDSRTAYDARSRLLDACESFARTRVGDYPAGTQVTHYAVEPSGDPSDRVLSDVWIGVVGERVGLLEVTIEGAGVAPEDIADEMADALVAGLRSGWAQETERPLAGAEPDLRPQLPSYDERGLVAALEGWGSAERVRGEDLPTTPCLARLRSGVSGSSGGSPWGGFVAIEGYAEPGPEAFLEAERVIDGLRACRAPRMTETILARGVTLMTYDAGGTAGHGAVWVASNEDRAMVVAVDGAATAVPAEAAEAGGAWLTSVLEQHWPEAR